MDEAIAKLLDDNYKGWDKIKLQISAKKAFMTMYLDNTPEGDNCAYYEGWLDALDTFEVWLKEFGEYTEKFWDATLEETK